MSINYDDSMDSISQISARFIDNYVLQTASGVVIDSNSTGRNAQLESIEAAVAEYSAVMDESICSFCKTLDGKMIDMRTPEGIDLFNKYSPAQHQNCRCIWFYLDPSDPDVPKEIGVINDGFEKNLVDDFKKIQPGKAPSGKEWKLPEIAYNYAQHNVYSTPQYWEKELGDITKLDSQWAAKRIRRAETVFGNWLGKVMSGNYIGEVDANGFPIGTINDQKKRID
jgi:hypothetical protein